MKLSDEQIEAGKAATVYDLPPHHEHNDCIRLAYEWLDAQQIVKQAPKRWMALKHVIQNWAGRYVSSTDVQVAAQLHPRIEGTYPNFNISRRLTRPHDRRLEGIGQALKHPNYRELLNENLYPRREE